MQQQHNCECFGSTSKELVASAAEQKEDVQLQILAQP